MTSPSLLPAILGNRSYGIEKYILLFFQFFSDLLDQAGKNLF